MAGSPEGLTHFSFSFAEVKLKETDWQYEDEYELLKEDITLIADQCRSDETKKMVNVIEVSFIIDPRDEGEAGS